MFVPRRCACGVCCYGHGRRSMAKVARVGSEPQGFATCRSCGQSTERFPDFGCHTQVVGAEHTLYKTAISFFWMSWTSSTLLVFYLTVYSPSRNSLLHYVCSTKLVQQFVILLPYTLAPLGLWISAIKIQNLHRHWSTYTADGPSTITRYHIGWYAQVHGLRSTVSS